eukprot:CAMPEP_0177624428 /NCGR_PEP_ID=MMETSP0419_2-20121207/29485_1 /TAXON_ID=582737 /ORGANISM="Tetraselmis sp., Strain GSL018" /LENGTH=512 /DNA_ID=CAMNT_0019125155 /DNA_START=589 /DNA_END=2128 /DNA_ORIENTATION=-
MVGFRQASASQKALLVSPTMLFRFGETIVPATLSAARSFQLHRGRVPRRHPHESFSTGTRPFTCLAALPPDSDLLLRWKTAVSKVSLCKVLPLGFGGFADANTGAWYGDRILSAAIAKELRSLADTHTPGQLTEIYGAASSNENMAAHIDLILPPCLLDAIGPPQSEALQVHDYGTMLEACVKEVAGEDDGAVSELARFLLSSVTHNPRSNSLGAAAESDNLGSGGFEDTRYVSLVHRVVTNPKGRLLELGGVVWSERVGGSDHAPRFLGVAELMGVRREEMGSSMKAAEKAAAMAVLTAAGFADSGYGTQRVRFNTAWHSAGEEAERGQQQQQQQQQESSSGEEESERGGAAERGLWMQPLVLGDEHRVADPKHGEDLPTWFQRKATVHRCLLAPDIFPEAIRSVEVWSGSVAGGKIGLIRVETESHGTRVFVSPQPEPSRNKAHVSASREAQRFICFAAGLPAATDDDDSDDAAELEALHGLEQPWGALLRSSLRIRTEAVFPKKRLQAP